MKATDSKKESTMLKPDRKKIKKMLIDKDLSMSDLARQYGCRPQMVSQLIGGATTSKKLQRFIEKRLSVRPGELFLRNSSDQAA